MTLQKLVSRKITAIAVLASILVLTAATVAAAAEPTWGSWQSQDPVRTLEVDIAEDMTRFVYNEDVVYEDGMPKHGSSFVTMGYIYPKGTLDGATGASTQTLLGLNATEGVNLSVSFEVETN